jgi:single-strand DNA-binding protein
MSLSKIVVSGKVIRPPEKRFTPNTNVAVTEFAIAVESPARPDGLAESTAVKIITWRDLAERTAGNIRKGDTVVVDGRLQVNNYSTSEGQRRKDVEIEAVNIENLSANAAITPSNQGLEDYSEPLPVPSKVPSKASSGANSQDLESIFASEEEIPF